MVRKPGETYGLDREVDGRSALKGSKGQEYCAAKQHGSLLRASSSNVRRSSVKYM